MTSYYLLGIMLACAVCSMAAAQPSQREQVLIIIDLLEPLDPGAEDFATAKDFLAADISALFEAVEEETPDRQHLEYLFNRTERSLQMLGDEGGYTAAAVQNISGKRSLDNYRELQAHLAKLREKTLPQPIPRQPAGQQSRAADNASAPASSLSSNNSTDESPPSTSAENNSRSTNDSRSVTETAPATPVTKGLWRRILDWLSKQ